MEIPVLKLVSVEDTCVFFDNDGCAINEVKPYYCLAAPVISPLFNNPAVRELFEQHCAGYGRGHLYSVSEIEIQLEEERVLEEHDIREYFQGGALDDLLELFRNKKPCQT